MALTRASAKTIWSRGQRPTSANYADLFDALPFTGVPVTPGEIIAGALTTASAHTVQGGGVAGISIFESITTASAHRVQGGGTAGINIFESATTASAQTNMGGGVAGRQIYEAITTASARSALEISSLVATTAQAAAGTNTSSVFITPGLQKYSPFSPKAFVSFNSAGTISLKANISSVSKVATGVFTIAFSRPLATSRYVIAGIGGVDADANGVGIILTEGTATPTVSACQVISRQGLNAGTQIDPGPNHRHSVVFFCSGGVNYG